MFKTITATLFATALAFTAMAPAARAADREEVARFIVGAAALALIAKAIDDQRDRDDARKSTTRVHDYHGINRQFYEGPRHRSQPVVRGVPHRSRTAVIPGRCLRTIETSRGPRNFFGRRCLNEVGYRGNLPRECLRTLDLPRRTVQAYGQRCLANRGVRVRN